MCVEDSAKGNCILYILQNPVRIGKVESSWDYRWSSAKWYVNEVEGDIRCHHFSTLEYGRPLLTRSKS